MTRTRLPGAASLLTLAAFGAGLGLLAQPGHTAQDKGAQDAPQGTWTAVALTSSGKKFPQEQAKIFQLTFSGEKVTLSFLGKSKTGTFKVVAGKKPKQFDMQIPGDRPNPGIYKLEKDTLTLCFSDGGERPTAFESAAGSRNILLVLKRGAIKLTAAEEKKVREAMEKVRTAAQRLTSDNNLKQLALAMHNYHDVFKHLPQAAIMDKTGKPLLSWRVALLPYLGENELYKEFKLDEPWDSPHNKKLLAKMPKVYAPVRGKTKEPYSTYYQGFVGPGTVFEPGKKLRMVADIPDGTSNTIFAVEAGEAVPWTRPADIPYDPKKPLPKLGGLFPDGFHIAVMDGSTRWVRRGFDERTFRLAITRNDGQPIDLNKLSK
jgi:uncharacterized protein (TIGR03067 family)